MLRDGLHEQPAPPAANAARWRLRDVVLDLTLPHIMAICNVTPDSFSDGGQHYSVERALQFSESAVQNGATLLDVGGESTRPGAIPVSVEEEIARVVPVIAAVRAHLPTLLISIDTVKSAVAAAAIDAGAGAINDVSAGRLDSAMLDVAAKRRVGVVLMHSRGSVADMASYTHAGYSDDPVGDICRELAQRVEAARAAGVNADQIVIDPGLGFSKTSAQSIAVLRDLHRVAALGSPILVGASRKRFIGELTGETEPSRRVIGTAIAHAVAVMRGARIVRTHDVAATRDALVVMAALLPV